MNKRMKHLIIICLSLIVFSGCKKEEETTWVYYDETYCSDAWGQHNIAESEKKDNVKKYLETKGVKVLEIEILNDGIEDVCQVCNCKTGKRIKCKTTESDIKTIINAKFYQMKYEK